jgi:hypothetical protein
MNGLLAWKRRRGSTQLVLDASLALSLLLALILVWAVGRFRTPASEKESFVEPPTVSKVVERTPAPAPAPRPMRIGVTPARPEFDDMGSLLKSLGEGYRYRAFPLEDLGDLNKISEYNIIFLTCSGVAEAWVKDRMGQAARPNTVQVTLNDAIIKRVCGNLQTFVANGGTLYVSDLHFGLVASAFPDLVDYRKVDTGRKQTVKAEVIDPRLRELIGPQLSLQFDQPEWRPAAFAGENVTTYLQGTYETSAGEKKTCPLLVKLPYKDGTVIFTSFHNEKVNSAIENKLLRYLVFTAVTANVEAQVTKTMVQGGFSPAKKSLFSASKEQPAVAQSYQCMKEGQLQFVLGFQGAGARLKLTVVGPDGQKLEAEGDATLIIDVPHAIVGQWQYTVTAIQLPNENFAFTVTVGQK